jgi:hypothetical protein
VGSLAISHRSSLSGREADDPTAQASARSQQQTVACPEICPEVGKNDRTQPQTTSPKRPVRSTKALQTAYYGTEGREFESLRARQESPANGGAFLLSGFIWLRHASTINRCQTGLPSVGSIEKPRAGQRSAALRLRRAGSHGPPERRAPPQTADRSEDGAGIVRLARHATDRQEPYAIGTRQELAPRGRPDADDVVGV